MSNIFSEIGISALDFIGISVPFILTMLFFFESRNRKHFWPHPLMLLILVLQCAIAILLKSGLTIKIFAALVLMTVLIIETGTKKRKNLAISKSEL
ncbi:MAG TPA: hypothetical protein VGO96_05460 [Pyrinomonadaceae bacterium]|jgi:hypothetical protein|nr:hypothetical protein [Pyrinomonadaceae bacterium]